MARGGWGRSSAGQHLVSGSLQLWSELMPGSPSSLPSTCPVPCAIPAFLSRLPPSFLYQLSLSYLGWLLVVTWGTCFKTA